MTPTAAVPLARLDALTGTRRFTVAEYHQLIEAEMLGPDDKVELLEGFVVFKADYPELLPADTAFPEWRWLRPWTSDEYARMLDLGIIDREEKLERLDGYLVPKMPQNLPHRSAMSRLRTRFAPLVPKGWWLDTDCPVALGFSDPEPDGVVLRGADADYDHRVPVATDIGIVIEVSDSTLEMDRAAKGRGYARAGIPVYWIVNVADKQIEVYTDPDAGANPPAYRTRTDFKPGESVPVVLDGAGSARVPVSEVVA